MYSHLDNAPVDISKVGENLKCTNLLEYPKNSEKRSFQPDWVKKFKWLEYSKSRDAVFCYPCRQFSHSGTKENAFITTGFRNWKQALTKDKGFQKHALSQSHIISMSMWTEKEEREKMNLSVSSLVYNDVLEKNRYYVQSIAEIVQFLVINELALRGTYDIDEHEEIGLFQNRFKYAVKNDMKLAECIKVILSK